MKDSGIPWIGEIPEEWGISRVGLHFDIILGKMLCSVQPSDDYTLEKYYRYLPRITTIAVSKILCRSGAFRVLLTAM